MKGKMVAVFAALFLATLMTYGRSTDGEEIQDNIAQHVLRFHVLANSDSSEDQALKLKVKEAVVDYLATYLDLENLSLPEAEQIVMEKREDVITLAESVIRENGYDYGVTAELVTDYFPVKSYGDLTFPAGEYEAFRIKIGNAEGKNWWCILYPPLCFVDVTYGYVPEESKESLKNILEEDAYEVITGGGVADGTVEIRSKFLDLIRKLR